MAVDAYVQLALIEKAKRVFAADAGVFLSFPLVSPLSFKPEALAAVSAPASAADYAAAAEFARIVNFLPRDIVASGYGDRYLWDVYADVLARADVADGSADAQGGTTSGSALLYTVEPDGTRTETAVYRAYRQYRDAWIVAREDYGEHKLTGELADNPEVARHWTEVEEPALRAALAQAETDWKTLGRRDDVEAALQAERDAALQDPRARWREWTSAFNPDLDLLTEASGSRYAPTGLSPKDFTRDTAWLHFDLTAGEVEKLVSAAPATLKLVLDNVPSSTIDHVSFDYRSVAVVRPWFQSSLLTSRIWRTNDPELALSDGVDPPSGTCPGYVTAVVFLRNLQVTSRSAAPTPPVRTNLLFTLPVQRLVPRDLQAKPTVVRAVTPAPTATNTAVAQRAFSRLESQSLTSAPTLTAKPPVRSFAFEHTAQMAPMMNQPIRVIKTGAQNVVLPGRMPTVDPAPPIAPPTVPTPAPVERHDEIAVLAFICKRLPKVPDPMPGLRWI